MYSLELRAEPESILAHRYDNEGALEVLVQWADLPQVEATWENASLLNHQFPQFHLEDKVKLLAGGIAIPFNIMRGWITYQRRKLAAPDQNSLAPSSAAPKSVITE